MNGRLIEIVPCANHRKHKGGNLKNRLIRPWLTGSGVQRSTSELKEISKIWNEQTWNEYLDWFETGRKDKLISPQAYDAIGDTIEKNIFEEFEQESCSELQSFCDRLLSTLPAHQQKILSGIYLEGKTFVTIAAQLKRSTSNIYQNKNKAIRTLKREHDGEKRHARRIMRGVDDFLPEIKNSIWSENLSQPVHEQRAYGNFDYQKVLLGHKSPELREVFSELSERSCQIIYLKFWSNLTYSQIARQCSMGLNTVETIIEATVFKIKSKVAENLNSDRAAGQAAFFIKGE